MSLDTSKKMNDDLFDFILSHAIGDCIDSNYQEAEENKEKITVSKKFEQFFKKQIAKQKRRDFTHALPRRAKRAAICIVSAIAILFGTLMTQPPVQAAVKSVFYSWGDAFLDYELNQDDYAAQNNTPIYGIKVGYLPDGYEFDNARISPWLDSRNTYTYSIATSDEERENKQIDITYCYSNISSNGGVDNEHGVLTPLNIAGATEIQYIKSNVEGYFSYVMWIRDDYFFKLIVPYGMDETDIVNIAESIEIIK